MYVLVQIKVLHSNFHQLGTNTVEFGTFVHTMPHGPSFCVHLIHKPSDILQRSEWSRFIYQFEDDRLSSISAPHPKPPIMLPASGK